MKKWAESQRSDVLGDEDWDYLEQVADVLAPLEELTLEVSKRAPQISMAVPIYYLLHDYLSHGSDREEGFEYLRDDIAAVVSAGFRKYQTYYWKMDELDSFYISLLIDPRHKHEDLEKELGEDADLVIGHIKKKLKSQYQRQRNSGRGSESRQYSQISTSISPMVWLKTSQMTTTCSFRGGGVMPMVILPLLRRHGTTCPYQCLACPWNGYSAQVGI